MAKVVIWTAGLIFVLYGVAFTLAPAPMADLVTGDPPDTASGSIDMRATYGGMSLAVGALILMLGTGRATVSLSLLITAVVLLSMAATRLLGFFLDRDPNTMMYVYLAAEVLAGGLALHLRKGLEDPFNVHGSEPDPALGELRRTDDDDVDHLYAITSAEYNIYEQGDHHWLTFRAEADHKIEPDDDENPEPWLEANLFFREDPSHLLRAATVLEIPSYDEDLGNLANMYYWTHCPFDGKITVEAATDGELTALVSGEADDNPVALRAVFKHNPAVERSFT